VVREITALPLAASITMGLTLSCCVVACSDRSASSQDDAGPSTSEAAVVEPDVAFDVVPADVSPRECRLAMQDGSVCACREIGQRPPTLYLLLDRSGSMADRPTGSARSKWSLVRSALLDREIGALRKLGTRISLAMAWFPSPSPSSDVCEPGKQAFGPVWGSDEAYDALDAKLASATPRGGTPTAASLRRVANVVAALPKPVNVLLATDGAPTCGSAPCGIDSCTYNLEHKSVGFISCDASTNCCDPAKTGDLASRGCADVDASAAAAAALVSAGAKVFVLGVPGTIPEYTAALDALAIAGGTPRDGTPRYYAVTEPTQEALAGALSSIAAKVIDTCTVSLDAPVHDPGTTNVLLDGTLVESDPVDGWRWTSPSTIELAGAACARIHEGTVTRIQVIVGCRTVAR